MLGCISCVLVWKSRQRTRRCVLNLLVWIAQSILENLFGLLAANDNAGGRSIYVRRWHSAR